MYHNSNNILNIAQSSWKIKDSNLRNSMKTKTN